ncbi:polyphosphoinositide phosphatase [Verticillium alfalfae VaMs.102]|uniref:Polyphosphoinositide phosphatase n=1 Tax=Verticillium alfalfae (strain VaMs.102 / ATCC MYA-4576 / FGSC 10136) TaxID=526221 RepID=C9SUK2_VERA1|nr:polyphosphoinositide phosphatase [Verticillium alfalfae VaMs.102]EEY22112.1 polyphosphoinositide phosphatase [Verticillium alfalfae VaMs.102]
MADQAYLDDGVPISGSFHDSIIIEADSASMLSRTQPVFPPLRNDDIADSPSTDAQLPPVAGIDDNDDNEPAIAKPFARANSPEPAGRGPALDDKTHERLLYKMHKFSLYETTSRYYIVGGDVTERRYRILKIDRTTEDSDLSITDDKIVYSQREMNQLLDTIDDGNKGNGGIKLRCTTWGLLGFIKFTGPYYMLLITKKSTVAMIGGHYVYQIDGTELVPLTPARFKTDVRNTEESRFLAILNNLDLTRSFYYSYSYDITRTLQHNMAREREALAKGLSCTPDDDFNAMFVWNSHLLQPIVQALKDPFDWCRPIIHGYIDQAALSIYGRTAHITIIARRSRFFAGARFLKRGANDLGYVANDVETEQIVSEALTTSFHAPGPRLYASPQYTSYVQHRGSIPLYWTQDNTGVTPKPPIELNLVDPFYGAAALHFNNLFERYGAPIYVLNLVKARELQNGVARTNCIDCLDRTNAAQFVIGKRALGHQLHALGILEDTAIDYDTDAVNLFTHMYHDHGDTIAVQYGGSQLVNTMETYRKINQWTSHSRDMIESFKRYYNNSFLDGQRQEAYNLFLGNYIFSQGQPMLWDLATDYYLHHADPRLWSEKTRGDYINWFTPQYLEARSIQPRSDPPSEGRDIPVAFFDDYWLEYYRPSTLSSFLKMFPYKMNSTIKYIPFKSTQDGRYDLSPFKIRNETYPETQEKKKAKKEVTIVDPQSASNSRGPDTAIISPDRPSTGTGRGISIQRWLQPAHDKVTGQQGIMKATPEEPSVLPKTKPTPQEKSKAAQWTFTKAVHQSLNPSVSQVEANDYDRYVSHPQSLPLVVSAEEQAENDSEYRDYINGSWHLESHLQTGPEDDPTVYAELLRVGENPLDGDGGRCAEETIQSVQEVATRKIFLQATASGLNLVL